MAQFEHLQVFQSMSRSPNARLHAMAELGNGMAVARWSLSLIHISEPTRPY